MADEVHLLVLLLNLVDLPLLDVELAERRLDVRDDRVLLLPLLLDLLEAVDERAVQVVEPHLLDVGVFLMFDLIFFFFVDACLLILLLPLLACEEVHDQLVEAVILVLLDPLVLDLLLHVHHLVVPVGLLNTLVQLHLSEHLRAVKHALVLLQLPLQLLFLDLVVIRLVQHTRVMRRGWPPGPYVGCLGTRLHSRR